MLFFERFLPLLCLTFTGEKREVNRVEKRRINLKPTIYFGDKMKVKMALQGIAGTISFDLILRWMRSSGS
ncbi:hypothetical protein DWU89_10140 [Parabacteroides acidifaciens]|uniref:Uncharacterized protein n=1 Tax=Parabacteroides acidifaciens TaxID=2290935 RepID=A0A3D8HE49_9BACT|nr:hypothetical protein DWU89_10140 [Parabacteroides acidifaciens]